MSDQIIDAAFSTKSNELSVVHSDYRGSIVRAQSNLDALREYVGGNFRENTDYGPPFPGSDKKSLLLPGAEKFNLLFDVRPDFVVIERVIDMNTGFCLYHLGCKLIHKNTGTVFGYGEGSCNSYESKFRYRNANRSCPNCGAETLYKSKQGPGYFCWVKKGGCGFTFPDNDPNIINQEVGKVENDNLFDVWNTILKQAEKRAMVAAVVYTGGVSELFTQDADDFVENESAKPRRATPSAQQRKQPSPQEPKHTEAPKVEPIQEPVKEHDEPEQKMVILFDGKRVPVNNQVNDKQADWFRNMFVGNSTGDNLSETGKWHSKHLVNHLRKHFHADKLTDLNMEKFDALLRYTLLEKGNAEHGRRTSPWYDEPETTALPEVSSVDSVSVGARWRATMIKDASPDNPMTPISLDTVLQKWNGKSLDECPQGDLDTLSALMDAIDEGTIKWDRKDAAAGEAVILEELKLS